MMVSDVESQRLTASGTVFNGRARLRSFTIAVTASTVGNVQFRDGGASGAILCEVDVPSTTTPNAFQVLLPGTGILFATTLYATITNATSVTTFYA